MHHKRKRHPAAWACFIRMLFVGLRPNGDWSPRPALRQTVSLWSRGVESRHARSLRTTWRSHRRARLTGLSGCSQSSDWPAPPNALGEYEMITEYAKVKRGMFHSIESYGDYLPFFRTAHCGLGLRASEIRKRVPPSQAPKYQRCRRCEKIRAVSGDPAP